MNEIITSLKDEMEMSIRLYSKSISINSNETIFMKDTISEAVKRLEEEIKSLRDKMSQEITSLTNENEDLKYQIKGMNDIITSLNDDVSALKSSDSAWIV